MSAGNVVRITVVLAAVVAAAGSATSSSNDANKNNAAYAGGQSANAPSSPPPPQQMEPARALGLWRSTFGAVKIEADNSKGGLTTGSVQGVWVYQRQGQEVVGYFAGNLRGNVLDFTWQEPNNPPLTGRGYLVFDPQGRQYSGRWWSDRKDRIGDWNGWRQAPAQQNYGQQQWGAQPDPYGGASYGTANPYGQGGQYGGAAYGYQPQPQPYYPQQPPRQPQPQPYYPQQPRQPQPQPYYPQRQPQPQPYPGQRQPQPGPYYPSQPPQPQPAPQQPPPYGY